MSQQQIPRNVNELVGQIIIKTKLLNHTPHTLIKWKRFNFVNNKTRLVRDLYTPFNFVLLFWLRVFFIEVICV